MNTVRDAVTRQTLKHQMSLDLSEPDDNRRDMTDSKQDSIAGNGLKIAPGYLSSNEQDTLLAAIRAMVEAAPLFTPVMPKTGKPFSVRMSNCGPLGWVSDRDGYRYQPDHPVTGAPWPPIPDLLSQAWSALAGYPHPPQACLINYFDAPVVSLSLGDTALFRIGGTKRGDPTRSLRLASGDALVLGGEARLVFHGVDRIIAGTSSLLKDGGRINLTLRRVTKPG
jgi:alkylated DNA repair protein (DNA oxidative demethylase)